MATGLRIVTERGQCGLWQDRFESDLSDEEIVVKKTNL